MHIYIQTAISEIMTASTKPQFSSGISKVSHNFINPFAIGANNAFIMLELPSNILQIPSKKFFRIMPVPTSKNGANDNITTARIIPPAISNIFYLFV